MWAIVGLGWLGSALQARLIQRGVESWGTTRASFNFLTDALPAREHSVLFFNTPPLLALTPQEFLEKIKPTSASKIIFISSTSVYGDTQGAVDENSPALPTAPNGVWLLEVENKLREYFKERLHIIRPAGLIGGERHPAKTLSGRTQVRGGLDVVNLIHREDLLNFIVHPELPALVNAVAPIHPTREEYYNSWCERLGLARIEFIPEKTSERVVDTLHGSLIEWSVPKLDRL